MTNVDGKHVVVTGRIDGESRVTAQQKLREHGALVADTVTGSTQLLVTGAGVGPKKMEKAEKLGVVVVPWDALDFNGGAGAAPAAPVARLNVTRQIAPMLAHRTEAGEPLPSGPDWSFEIKWDGYRCVATVEGGKVAMRSRTDKTDLGERFPHIAAELAGFPDCVIDGECVVLDAQGASSFSSLVGASNSGGGTSRFIVFDMLELGCADMRSRALADRRVELADMLERQPGMYVGASPVSYDGEALYTFAAENGLEGIVSKRNSSHYTEGGRGEEWRKHKIRVGQEFVVVGYKPGDGKRTGGVGALLLAVNDNGRLLYCGKVGTGFDNAELARLTTLLDQYRIDECPAVEVHKDDAKNAVWVSADVVVQVSFQRWTEDGCLWHPVYQGERTDIVALDVVREPAATDPIKES